MSLSVKAAHGGLIMLSGQIAKVALQFVNVILLARLLQPEDFGLVAMVISIYGICDILLDFGLSTASIQAKNITHGQISNLFWVNLLIGLILSSISFASAGLLANFYNHPELAKIAEVISLVFIFNGISAQYKAQLNRRLEFSKLALADILATFASVCVGIYFAYTGHSYWTIVYQQITQACVLMMLYGLFGRWLPALPSKKDSIRGFFHFGLGLAGSQILGYFSRNIPSILIGYQLGATKLGLFDRANKLLMLPLNQLNAPSSTVAVPILSRLQAENLEKYNKFLLFGQNVIVHIVAFSLSLACCQTEQLVGLVLGSQWLEMVPVFKALSFAGIFLVLSYASYWVFLTKGITGSLFKLGLFGRPIVIAITSLGLMGGVIGVALAYSFGLMVNWLLGLFWLRKTGVPIKKMIATPLTVSISYYSAAYISSFLVDLLFVPSPNNILIGWLGALLILIVIYILIPAFNSSVNQLFEVKNYLRK